MVCVQTARARESHHGLVLRAAVFVVPLGTPSCFLLRQWARPLGLDMDRHGFRI